jgi:hypothetical protein
MTTVVVHGDNDPSLCPADAGQRRALLALIVLRPEHTAARDRISCRPNPGRFCGIVSVVYQNNLGIKAFDGVSDATDNLRELRPGPVGGDDNRDQWCS